MMERHDFFEINSFKNPDAKYAPVYIWVWNDICSKEIIDEQLIEMKNLGIRTFYILPEPKKFRPDSMPTNLNPDYLSDEYMKLCTYALKKGKNLGMNCWIYDEGGWPSGSACGKVIGDHPEYAQQSLKAYERKFSIGEIYKHSQPDVIATFLNDNEIIADGYIFPENSIITEYIAEKGTGSYPDLLNKKATEYFIETTHKKYAEALQNDFSEVVGAVFTDEPKAPLSPYNEELAKKYEAEYGESILPHLPLISGRISPTEENVHILRNWYDLCSKMFCDNFLLTCKKWANENGIAFTGHLDKDHSPTGCMVGGGNFNLMRALRCFDIPGIDVIWRQLYPENRTDIKNDMNCYNGFFPRYASSAASQNGTKYAMCEIFGVAGAALTYEIMRYTVGYLAVRGINIFNPFNFPLGRKGQLLAQELPIFTEKQIFYKDLCQFNRYTERLAYISSLGERVCKTALYYPVSDFQGKLNADAIKENFDNLGRKLEDILVDFDIIDDDIITRATITDNNSIRIGRAEYKNIIIPENACIPEATKKALDNFIQHGIKVTNSISDLAPVIHAEGIGLRAMHRKASDAEIFCLYMETGEKESYKIHLPSSKGYLLDLENGELQRFEVKNNILDISLCLGETAVILLTDEAFESSPKKNFHSEIRIPENFMFSKKTELQCDENGFFNIEHSYDAVLAKQGDWSELIGSEYSGSCIYKTSFTLSDEKIGKEGKLDLGDVRFSASIYLNEQFLGTKIMPPYTFKIPEGILMKSNTLKITVTNTSANWYVHTDHFDKWTTEELSPYFEGELKFAKDYVSGGLYGPVTLYTE